MAKIILSKRDTVLREIVLSKERITIGRRPYNDIVIEDLAISGEHAVIVTHDNDSFLEDLNSTNGTQVNGQPVHKHFLQDEDVIELAQFRLRYIDDGSDLPVKEKLDGVGGKINSPNAAARIKVLNGPSAGKEITLTKVLTTLGRPGIQVAAVTRSDNGYYLTHVEGETPKLNSQAIGLQPHPIFDGDVIDLSGIQMQINLV